MNSSWTLGIYYSERKTFVTAFDIAFKTAGSRSDCSVFWIVVLVVTDEKDIAVFRSLEYEHVINTPLHYFRIDSSSYQILKCMGRITCHFRHYKYLGCLGRWPD